MSAGALATFARLRVRLIEPPLPLLPTHFFKGKPTELQSFFAEERCDTSPF